MSKEFIVLKQCKFNGLHCLSNQKLLKTIRLFDVWCCVDCNQQVWLFWAGLLGWIQADKAKVETIDLILQEVSQILCKPVLSWPTHPTRILPGPCTFTPQHHDPTQQVYDTKNQRTANEISHCNNCRQYGMQYLGFSCWRSWTASGLPCHVLRPQSYTSTRKLEFTWVAQNFFSQCHLTFQHTKLPEQSILTLWLRGLGFTAGWGVSGFLMMMDWTAKPWVNLGHVRLYSVT